MGVWSAGRGEERTVEIPRASEKELKWRRGRPYVAMEGKSFVLDKGALAGDDAKALAARAAREALLVERLLGAGHGDGVRDSDQLVARGARLVVLVGEDRCLWLGTLLDHGLDEWDDEGAVATRSRSALYRPKPVSLQRPSNGSLTKKKGGGGGTNRVVVELSLRLGVLASVEPLVAARAAEAIPVPQRPILDHLDELAVPEIKATPRALLVADGRSGGGGGRLRDWARGLDWTPRLDRPFRRGPQRSSGWG